MWDTRLSTLLRKIVKPDLNPIETSSFVHYGKQHIFIGNPRIFLTILPLHFHVNIPRVFHTFSHSLPPLIYSYHAITCLAKCLLIHTQHTLIAL